MLKDYLHRVGFCLFVKQNIAENLGYKEPKVVQSMYIFKQPRIGGAGKWRVIHPFILDGRAIFFATWLGEIKNTFKGNRKDVKMYES